jgi:hypothetical protein
VSDPPGGCDIFISYRRSDSGGHARLLDDRLRARVGRERVFFDVESLGGGEIWRDALRQHLHGCRVVLAVIAPDWVTARDTQGRPRLSSDDDIVRNELIEADARKKEIIPVYVGGARPLDEQPLPPDWPEALRRLAERQYVPLRHTMFDTDFLHLEERLRALLPDIEFQTVDREPASRTLGMVGRTLLLPPVIAFAATVAIHVFFEIFGEGGFDTLDEFGSIFIVLAVVTCTAVWGWLLVRWFFLKREAS